MDEDEILALVQHWDQAQVRQSKLQAARRCPICLYCTNQQGSHGNNRMEQWTTSSLSKRSKTRMCRPVSPSSCRRAAEYCAVDGNHVFAVFAIFQPHHSRSLGAEPTFDDASKASLRFQTLGKGTTEHIARAYIPPEVRLRLLVITQHFFSKEASIVSRPKPR